MAMQLVLLVPLTDGDIQPICYLLHILTWDIKCLSVLRSYQKTLTFALSTTLYVYILLMFASPFKRPCD
jgi:hypothetical protein